MPSNRVEDPGLEPRRVATGQAITRLGAGLDRTGRIAPESADATVRAVAGFAAEARALGADPVLFGTAALREAENGRDVADAIGRAAAGRVRILSGEEEAAATWRGVTRGRRLGPGAIVLDIGGGSTEFTSAGEGGDIVSRSMPLGSVRQAERYLESDPPTDAEWASMRGEIRARVAAGLGGRRTVELVGVAGTVTQLAALELAMADYDPDKVEGMSLSREVVAGWSRRLRGLSLAHRRRLVGMVPERADTVVAGTAILEIAIEESGAGGVIVSEYDSLWGMLEGVDA